MEKQAPSIVPRTHWTLTPVLITGLSNL